MTKFFWPETLVDLKPENVLTGGGACREPDGTTPICGCLGFWAGESFNGRWFSAGVDDNPMTQHPFFKRLKRALKKRGLWVGRMLMESNDPHKGKEKQLAAAWNEARRGSGYTQVAR